MSAFIGFFTFAKAVLVEVFIGGLFSLKKLQKRAVEVRNRMKEDETGKGDQEDLEQEMKQW